MRPLYGLLLTALVAVAALTFPPLTGRVVDEANLLPASLEKRLSEKLRQLETSRGIQLVVVTLPSLQGRDIADYGYRLGRHWGIGKKSRDNGLLLIVAPHERKVRIEVGYGLEGIVTDYAAHRIIEERILPRFRTHDMAGGIEAGVDALSALLQPEAKGISSTEASTKSRPEKIGALALLPLLIVALFFKLSGNIYRDALGFAFLSGLFAWGAAGSLIVALGAAVLAFFLYVLLRKKIAGHITETFPEASEWLPYRESGSGGTSGGGSFGGFSGSGGSFGGGGASGSW